ncbi:TPA: conjugative relaxase [Pseudomonas aeruginosa]|nr:conjugative relaxase [Pseudomonas aeruginosa]
MLSHQVLTRKSIGALASYYGDGADDYYAKEGESMEWQGEGANALGLAGEVDSQRFKELLAGEISPGVKIIRSDTRKDSKERIGIDLTFSAPKSVSLQALIGGDAAIIKAHDLAVTKAIELAEQRAQARRKENGITMVENTGNLVVAKFRHETSREKDPQLHTHAVVLNMTQRSDGQWRALKNDEIIKMTKYLGAMYRAELAAELAKQGYSIRHERDGMFELGHISREQLEGFSQRSAQIEERLASQGKTRETASAAEKQAAAMETRSPKTGAERDVLFKEWKGRAKDLGIDFKSREWAGVEAKGPHTERNSTPSEVAADLAAKRAVRFAVNHLTERQSVMTEGNLINTAVKHGMAGATMKDVEAEIKRQIEKGYLIQEKTLYRPAENALAGDRGQSREAWIAELEAKGMSAGAARERVDTAINRKSLIETEPQFTTQTALEREKRIHSIERDGRGAMQPIMSNDIAKIILDGTNLNAGQRGAAELMSTTADRVIGVQGLAGTGKSHMLDTAKQMIEAQGYEVRALAPYASQVKALRELGVESNTLASFLKAKDKGINERTVLVVDEAGVVPARQMDQLLKIAEKAGARVVLMGDTAQTKAIEAGRPFDQLQAAGMATAKMEEIQRQKDPLLKEAVELSARGKSAESLSKISSLVQIEDKHERRQTIANEYVALTPSQRDQAIIVSGTNEARREINQAVREGLGTLGKGVEVDTLTRTDTTQAERRFSKYYRVGDMIQPEVDYKKTGLKRGELYEIKDTGPGNRLTLQSAAGELVSINPMQHTKLSVYQAERAELAPGDKVRITRNDAALDLANGDRFTVEAVTKDAVTLRSEHRSIVLSTDKPLHLDHAYATTVHSSQGLTADRVLIDADSKSKTTAKDVYYVAISRARFDARIYTDDIAALPRAISRENVKHAALDLSYKLHRSPVEKARLQELKEQAKQHAEAGKGEKQSRTRTQAAERTQGAKKAAGSENTKQGRVHTPKATEAAQKGSGRSDARLPGTEPSKSIRRQERGERSR